VSQQQCAERKQLRALGCAQRAGARASASSQLSSPEIDFHQKMAGLGRLAARAPSKQRTRYVGLGLGTLVAFACWVVPGASR